MGCCFSVQRAKQVKQTIAASWRAGGGALPGANPSAEPAPPAPPEEDAGAPIPAVLEVAKPAAVPPPIPASA